MTATEPLQLTELTIKTSTHAINLTRVDANTLNVSYDYLVNKGGKPFQYEYLLFPRSTFSWVYNHNDQFPVPVSEGNTVDSLADSIMSAIFNYNTQNHLELVEHIHYLYPEIFNAQD